MKVDHVLLLSAGKGTRMGNIGKKLPKVIWPVFEKSLLELQVEFARKLTKNSDIYINLFHEKEKIINFTKNSDIFNDVTIIEEEETLFIGGAVHNLAKKLDYKGNLLVLNSDQFLYFDQTIFEKGLKFIEEFDGVLFSYEVNSNDLYGALDIEDGLFNKVIPNEKIPRNEKMKTYTGMSLWNLDRMTKSEGASHFFETVANAEKSNIKVVDVRDFKYWDFGTIKRYYDSMFEIVNLDEDPFKTFLIKTGALKLDRLKKGSYNSNTGINLSGNFVENCFKSINITAESVKNLNPCIIGFNEVDEVNL